MTRSLSQILNDYIAAYLVAAMWATFIFLLSSRSALPSFDTSIADFLFKKSAHMFVYGVLYVLLYRAGRKMHPQNSWAVIWLPIIISLIYAITDELHQYFVPGRYGTIRDVGIDMLGVGIVFLRQYRYI